MKYFFFIGLYSLLTASLSAQNVGIGTVAPAAKLHISNNDSAVAILENSQALKTSVSTALYFKTGTSFLSYTGAIKTIGESSSAARLGLFTYASFAGNGLKERMSITDIGSIGMGTTTPQTSLHINPNGAGSILIGANRLAGGYTNLEIGINKLSDGYAYLQATKASGASYGYLLLNPNGGRVGIATTTPTATLDVHGGISLPIKLVTSNYTALETDYTIVVDMQNDTNKVINIYLPARYVNPGRIIKVVPINMAVSNAYNGYWPPQDKNVINIYDAGGTTLYETLYNRFFQEDTEGNTTGGTHLFHRDFRSEKKTSVTLQCIAATGWIITDLDSDKDHWGFTY